MREAVTSLFMVTDTAKQAKPRKNISQNGKFLQPGWRDDETNVALYLLGFVTLWVSSLLLGVSIGGFWGLLLGLLGSLLFPFLMVGVIFSGMYLRFSWPFNIIVVTALLATVGALAFGVFAPASLGLVAWVPFAAVGALTAVWASLFDG